MTTIQPLLHHMDSAGDPVWTSSSNATVSESSTSLNEGQTLTITVNTTNVADGLVLYWTVDQHTGSINPSDFSVYSGTVTITNGTGTIASIGISADVTTEGEEKFAVKFYTEAEYTNNVANTNVITINDTSTAPVQHSHSSGTVSVPANAYDISIELAGGAGGKGGKGGALSLIHI